MEKLRRKITWKFLHIFLWKSLTEKRIKEVGTICFEIRIPMKKPKIFTEFFYLSFQSKFGFNNFILEKTKIFMETLLYREKATGK